MHTHTHEHTHTHMHTHVRVHTHTHTCAHTHMHTQSPLPSRQTPLAGTSTGKVCGWHLCSRLSLHLTITAGKRHTCLTREQNTDSAHAACGLASLHKATERHCEVELLWQSPGLQTFTELLGTNYLALHTGTISRPCDERTPDMKQLENGGNWPCYAL